MAREWRRRRPFAASALMAPLLLLLLLLAAALVASSHAAGPVIGYGKTRQTGQARFRPYLIASEYVASYGSYVVRIEEDGSATPIGAL